MTFIIRSFYQNEGKLCADAATLICRLFYGECNQSIFGAMAHIHTYVYILIYKRQQRDNENKFWSARREKDTRGIFHVGRNQRGELWDFPSHWHNYNNINPHNNVKFTKILFNFSVDAMLI